MVCLGHFKGFNIAGILGTSGGVGKDGPGGMDRPFYKGFMQHV